MAEAVQMNVIARMHSDFDTKFGVPRQSDLVPDLKSTIVFEKEYRDENMLRGLEQFSHLWLIWLFSENPAGEWSPTVRPPRLGGNVRVGVFATRSPYRPNPVGLSCVRLGGVRRDPKHGWVIDVYGADLVNGTPIIDIKPYIPYADIRSDASGGFTDSVRFHTLQVILPDDLRAKAPADKVSALIGVLQQDPRPSYQDDPDRVYGVSFAGMNVRFKVAGDVLTVTEIQ